MLEGIRVLDMTYFIAGPVGTQVLADMGAEVIKIEGPFAAARTQILQGATEDGVGQQVLVGWPGFSHLNRNKKSAVLNLTKPEGKALFMDLVLISDVVVENYSLRVMRNFGLEYADLKKVNPGIILISMPGYGREGPYKEYPSWGETIESTAGLTNLTGYADGPPMRSAIYMPDPLTGMHGALAAIVCLNQRNSTGEGQHVTLSHLECATQLTGEAILDVAMNSRTQVREGNRHASHAPHSIYPCQGDDEWIAIAVGADEEWNALCNVIGNLPWTRLPEFEDAPSRYSNQETLDQYISKWTEQYAKYDLMNRLQAEGVPAGAVLNARDLVSDPHLVERNYFWEYGETLPDGPEFPFPGGRARYEGSPEKVMMRAPAFGEHNAFVLGDLLCLSKEQIEHLRNLEVTVDILDKL